MRIPRILLIAAALVAAPMASQAGDFSYSYAEAGWARVAIDDSEINLNFDGFFLRGSVEVTDRFFLFADYLDVSKSGIDVQRYALGVGGNYPLSDALDVVGRAAWAKSEVSGFGYSADDDGYLVSAGLRGRPGERFELEGSVAYEDYGNGSDDTILTVGARYFFTDMFAVGAEFQKFEDADAWGIGFRVSFGD